MLEKYEKQTARGYLIKCSDGEFFVEEDCFKFSDFLYEQIQGKSLSNNELVSMISLSDFERSIACYHVAMWLLTFVDEKSDWNKELFSTLFSYDDRKARAKFKGKKNNIFDFTAFRIQTIRKIFDLMHGIDIDQLSIGEACEALIFCNYDTVW